MLLSTVKFVNNTQMQFEMEMEHVNEKGILKFKLVPTLT